MMTNLFVIFTRKLAYELADLGFRIIRTGPNAQKPWLDVYMFEPTEEFMEAYRRLKGGSRNG